MFRPGHNYTHEEIYQTLSVGNAGGIRIKANTDHTVRRAVLLTSVPTARIAAENPYHDRLEGDVLVYTGTGKEGDQALGGRNKRILEQTESPFPIYGFRLIESRRSNKTGPRRWKFLGMLSFLRHYKETQIDVRGAGRSAWMFEFRVLSDFESVAPEFDTPLMNKLLEEQERKDPRSDDDSIIDLGAPPVSPADERMIDPAALEQLRGRMLAMAPERFEHLIRDVLVLSGFQKVHVTRYSQDGGIDVNALAGQEMWPIRNLLVQIQAKRWLHTVGRREVAELRGSLQPNARGAVVTTSHYSKAAMKEAEEPGKKPITLVDGYTFAQIVANSGAAVS
jgi:hypothetical protein